MGHNCCPTEQKLSLSFSKYHGNANDFIIVDLGDTCATGQIDKTLHWFSKNAPHLCDRNRGIGADGIILIEQSQDHLAIWVINADGSRVQNCGNGLRCVARWYFDKNDDATSITIKLAQQNYECLRQGAHIAVLMGDCLLKKRGDLYFDEDKISAQVYQAHLGNHHLVLLLNRWPENIVKLHAQVCEKIEDWADFNVNYVFRDPRLQVFAQVFERGVGFTMSCGSGACATASALVFSDGWLEPCEVSVLQPGGQVCVTVDSAQILPDGGTFCLRQSGAAAKVFDGKGQFTF